MGHVLQSEEQLDDLLSEPTAGVIETLGRLPGDLMILGVAGPVAMPGHKTLDTASAPAINVGSEIETGSVSSVPPLPSLESVHVEPV